MGLALLGGTSEDQRGLLRFFGALRGGSSLLMMYRVTPLAKPSSAPAFTICGVLCGLMGGLFAVFGPPATFMMYRQPDPIAAIRATLITLFSVTAVLRLIAVLWTEPVGETFWGLALLGAPVVLVAAMAARHFPLPLSNQALRRFAFGLLLLSGISLMLKGFF